jgi:hypothetical protein
VKSTDIAEKSTGTVVESIDTAVESTDNAEISTGTVVESTGTAVELTDTGVNQLELL